MTSDSELSSLTSAFKCLSVRDPTHHSFSDMVVTPVFDQRPITTFGNKGSVPTTTTKLEPRKGPTDAWRDEMLDILSSEKLTSITGELRPPTIAELTAKAPGVPQDLIEAAHAQVSTEWWADASRLYYIVRGSINISGIYEKKDLMHIKSTFCQGDLRNGPMLLKWATTFTNPSSVASQSKLISKVLSAKLPASANLEQLGQHVSDLLIDWSSINGNNVNEPSSFYHTLLQSMPNVDSGKLAHLRFWISDQISEGGANLKDPSSFVERLVDRATNLGLQPANTVNAIGECKSINNCKFCVSHLCLKGNTKDQCVCFGRAQRPAGAKDGQWLYVTLCRDYLALVPGTTTLKGITLQELKDTVKRLNQG